MDGDRCDNRQATPAERSVSLALDLMVWGHEEKFIWWAASSADARRHVMGTDPRQQFELWTDAIVRAQHLCRVIEARLACEDAIAAEAPSPPDGHRRRNAVP